MSQLGEKQLNSNFFGPNSKQRSCENSLTGGSITAGDCCTIQSLLNFNMKVKDWKIEILIAQNAANLINIIDVESNVLYLRDYTRALFILIQNPIFSSQSTYTIFAHLLQQVTSLPNSDHQLLGGFHLHLWYSLLSTSLILQSVWKRMSLYK